MAVHIFAAIDVGSFELELGIYEISAKYGIRKTDYIRHVIALGKDTYDSGKISYELVNEMCGILGRFAEIMDSYKVEAYRAYATSAMREAKNNQIILDQIRVRTGIEVKIISNSEQRFIIYKAMAAKDAEFNKFIRGGTAAVDVGFGSMQVSLFEKTNLISTQNLPLGVLRIQNLLSGIQTDRRTYHKLVEELVDNELYTFRKMSLKDHGIRSLVGLGEAVLFLSRGESGWGESDKVTREEYNAFYDRLLRMPLDQIQENHGVNAEYAALLVPAAIIYKRMLDFTEAETFWIPGIRLCDGMAAEYAQGARLIKLNHDFAEDILVTSRNLAKRYKCHSAHTQVTEQYVLQIFDAMKRYHGMGPRERLLLQISAILHACGKFISMKNTSECAYNIIMATEIIGLSHLEREVVANVVRYNIREFDYNEVELDSSTEKVIRVTGSNDMTILIAKLTAILRMANSLDRSHKQKLIGCRMSVKAGRLAVSTDYDGDITLEIVSFERKSDFFEEIFGIRPILKQKRRI